MAQEQLPKHNKALLSPSVYPHPVDYVELVQTRIPYVFLAENYVYKLKKPVDMGFLDYTTLEKRRLYREGEVRLNRQLCSDAYLGVVTVNDENGRMFLYGEGEVLDYAVKMRAAAPGAHDGAPACRERGKQRDARRTDRPACCLLRRSPASRSAPSAVFSHRGLITWLRN